MVQKVYQLQRQGNLVTLRAYVADQDNIYRGIRLLVDTGATYTVLPVGFLSTLGYDVSNSTRKIPIAAAGGILQVPLVEVKRFSCLGCSADNFAIVALNLPLNSAISGLIGMDFLVRYRAVIDTGKAGIWIPD
jgi:predicted aspartyl protease